MAGGQGVLKAATFSKVIATGLRLGWVQGLPDYINALINVRFDMGNSPVLQRAVADYMESGKLDAHVNEMRPIYAQKCETICRSLEEHCGPYVRFQRPAGGFFLWVECVGASAKDVVREAVQEGLVFPVGALFFLDGERDDTEHIRLAFVTATLEQLEEVGPRLSRAFQRALGER
jgi:DNA-binding transcriptional MocR family regulator